MRGLEAEAYDRQYDDRELVRRIGRYFEAYCNKVILGQKTGFSVVSLFML